MSMPKPLDYQVNKLGLWCAVIAILTGVVAVFLPLDIPEGYAATHADRVAWLSENADTFIAAWANQIVAMLTLSGVFFAIAWKVRVNSPLQAILAGMVVLMSVMAFIIPKFMAVWTIPLLAEAVTNQTVGAEMADSLLLILNVSIPFSLYTSFDYLGFWLYAVFALLVAVPLYGETKSAKISAVSLGLFGVIYQLMLVALLFGEISAADIEINFMSASGLLLIVIAAMGFNFKSAMNPSQQ